MSHKSWTHGQTASACRRSRTYSTSNLLFGVPSRPFSMPTFRLQCLYDLRTTHIDNNIAGVSHRQVYNAFFKELRSDNWNRHQFSKWHKTGTTAATALGDFEAACAAAEARCGLSACPVPPNHAFHRVEVQCQTTNSVIRP